MKTEKNKSINTYINGDEGWTHLRNATCAAMTRCLSTTNWQLGHWHSRHRHNRLCPLRHEITPWLRHRAHLGVRSNLRPPPAPPRPPRTNFSVAGGVFIPWRKRDRERGKVQISCKFTYTKFYKLSILSIKMEAYLFPDARPLYTGSNNLRY